MANRRARTDSTTAKTNAFQAAKNPSQFAWPSETVTEMSDPSKQAHAMRIAQQIWTGRAPSDWRDFDRTQIAQLAITTVDLDELQTQISTEGYVTTKPNAKGNPTVARNPLLDPIAQLSNRQITLSRALGLTGTQADGRTVANAAKQQKATLAVVENLSDNLLATPPAKAML